MKQIVSSLFLCVSALAFSLSPALAGTPTSTPTPTRHTVIASISSDSITVDTGLVKKDYKIEKNTVFIFHGNRVTLNDLKSGMRVSVTPGFDGLTAATINAGDAPKVPPATAAVKK